MRIVRALGAVVVAGLDVVRAYAASWKRQARLDFDAEVAAARIAGYHGPIYPNWREDLAAGRITHYGFAHWSSGGSPLDQWGTPADSTAAPASAERKRPCRCGKGGEA